MSDSKALELLQQLLCDLEKFNGASIVAQLGDDRESGYVFSGDCHATAIAADGALVWSIEITIAPERVIEPASNSQRRDNNLVDRLLLQKRAVPARDFALRELCWMSPRELLQGEWLIVA